MIKPIKPSEVVKKNTIPDQMIMVVNNLIIEKWDGRSAIVKQTDIISRFLKSTPTDPKLQKQIYDKGWLNFEPIFRDSGWKVTYESPDRDEMEGYLWADAYFKFEKESVAGRIKYSNIKSISDIFTDLQ